jgi:hypothetical protein
LLCQHIPWLIICWWSGMAHGLASVYDKCLILWQPHKVWVKADDDWKYHYLCTYLYIFHENSSWFLSYSNKSLSKPYYYLLFFQKMWVEIKLIFMNSKTVGSPYDFFSPPNHHRPNILFCGTSRNPGSWKSQYSQSPCSLCELNFFLSAC